jgi:hypothetical protein
VEACFRRARGGTAFLLFEVTQIAKARAFVTSPEVPQAMQASGVVDNPDIYFLE